AAASTHQAAASTHQAAASTHQAAASTHQAAASTHQAAASTHQAAASTHQVAASTHQVAAGTHRVAVTAVSGEPVDDLTDERILLDFADERSVVQTRFPTTVLALARAAFADNSLDANGQTSDPLIVGGRTLGSLDANGQTSDSLIVGGRTLSSLVADGRQALTMPLPADPADIEHLVFLGTGWTVGLAHEAALKVREAAQAYSESYPAMDFRHGPVAVAGRHSLVWSLGDVPTEMDDVARSAGATAYRNDLDPLAQLLLVQRFALAMAAHRGLDPDRPRLLTRSVVLT
ncbi:SIS domain-containing protein, partial [Paractinoplanes bogorensis]|uniref:SIS domain-containing protein n=1 Tax=Paractinoplanes bogorensis TaxID=1610840 RepID=UPI001FEC92B7